MSVTYIVFRQICVMALLIFLGWLLARKGIINKAGNGQISGILTYIITPCVIINAFVSLEASTESLLRLVQALAVFGAVFVLSILFSLVLFRKQGPQTATNRAATVFANTGFFGIPLLQALFGETGVFYASIAVLYNNLLIWTWGMTLFSRGQKVKVKTVLGQPAALAAMAGIVIFLLRLWPVSAQLGAFAWFDDVSYPFLTMLKSVKELNTPVAMFVLGVNVYNANWKFDRSLLSAIPFILRRQFLIPAAVLLLTMWLPVDRTMLFSLFVEMACPIATMVSVLTLRYNAPQDEQERSTRIVVLSTLSALITVPLMVAFGNWLLPV
ncbi:MAG: AEC family transporter [Oscillospiraceae bacterium]|nr:AEC family transporter [Oscillospiraceae bacterium]